ncbi:DeoR/GlpR family DNA-binding transcription regulator [Alicyclobacillus sp. SO9]|uniref:DeoR/GlpR family DNA-binding transcription regulator n=1 Tax=Alicyclobacillus sp. SO9 TaxID=2665646 RepID=UPI0018E84D1E|nr:DeoR/GlpR family DNA-binding transcription regulator [Alicyclobacillus sp. SO9]QQE77923.1 DeoR/GlpR transcriptional regulator [Alicyclobacillus sp. SO9]
MLGEVRQQKLMELLKQQKSVRIRDLTTSFQVSEETIRRDLRKLEMDGLLRRTHGGAVLDNVVHAVPPIHQRTTEQVEAKRLVARAAASMVPAGSSVILDSGSTTLEIARQFQNKNVTVITNELSIAMELSSSPLVNLIMLGGTLQKGSYTLVGPECEDDIGRYNVDYVFLGSGGVSKQKGLTTSSMAEVELKRKMIAVGQKVYCVTDSSKLGRAALVTYAGLGDVTAIITNRVQQSSTLSDIEATGATFIFVD